MNEQARAQPPPDIIHSQVIGWARISRRSGGKWEVYWKGRNDIMMLLAHSLTYKQADELIYKMNDLLSKFNGIPFQPEVRNVECPKVQVDEQTQDTSQGGLEASTGDRS